MTDKSQVFTTIAKPPKATIIFTRGKYFPYKVHYIRTEKEVEGSELFKQGAGYERQ